MLGLASIRSLNLPDIDVKNPFYWNNVTNLVPNRFWLVYLKYFRDKYIDMMRSFCSETGELGSAYSEWINMLNSLNELRMNNIGSIATKSAMFDHLIVYRDKLDDIILRNCNIKYDEDLKEWKQVTVYYVYKDIIHYGIIVGKSMTLEGAVELAKNNSRCKPGEEYQEIGYVIAIDDNNSSYGRGRRIFAGDVPKSRILEVHIDPLDDSVKGEANNGRRSDKV